MVLRLYGYLGIALIAFAEINFYAKIEPFATWYIPIVWYGYILLIDSIVYRLKNRSLMSSYPKEFIFMVALSVPFWLIFEFYNLFTVSWIYTNYVWYVHLFDFTTIMPAVLETFSLINSLGLGKRFDRSVNRSKAKRLILRDGSGSLAIKLLIVVGVFAALLPVLVPMIGFPFIWFGLFLFIDPLNYLIGRPSIVQRVSQGKRSFVIQLFIAGIIMGFFWEFWNYQAYPKWHYNLPSFIPSIRLFEMPLFGYLGYLPFATEVFLFYALFRSFIFKKGNDLLLI